MIRYIITKIKGFVNGEEVYGNPVRSLTARELISTLIRDGFTFDRQSGAHQHYLHPDGRRVTVSYHRPSATFPKKTLKRMIEDQAHWTEDDLRRLKLIYYNDGNIGIGTTAPAAKLTVHGSETTGNGKEAAILLDNTAATVDNEWMLRAGGPGTNTPDGGFSIADKISYRSGRYLRLPSGS